LIPSPTPIDRRALAPAFIRVSSVPICGQKDFTIQTTPTPVLYPSPPRFARGVVVVLLTLEPLRGSTRVSDGSFSHEDRPMSWQRRVGVLTALMLALGLGLSWLGAAETPKDREAAMNLFRDGNFKDAYEGLRKLALDPKDDPNQVSEDLKYGIQCLQRLGRIDEVDEFREGVISAHGKNWRLLQTAAHTYTSVDHRGYIGAGKFNRGFKRGGGRMVNAMQRDRTRALQLMQQGLGETKQENDKPALASFCLDFASQLLHGAGYHAPWRLQ